MNYQQTIDHLYAHLPMFSRVGAIAYKEDLHNTIALCTAIGDPHKKFKTIHIAGTNGKGSTSHMLAAILQQAGYKTGLYTSPHLKDFRERIKIDGEMISQSFVVDFVAKTRQVSDAIEPSFFELTVAMAFDYFATEQVDIAVIETGLGGRLDSTNVINPLLSIITNIGYDHINILGNTLEKIAFEKAGIIKKNTPVIVGEYIATTRPVFTEKAAACNAPIYFAQEKFNVTVVEDSIYLLTCMATDIASGTTVTYTLDLPAMYQLNNLKTVLTAIVILNKQGFAIEAATVKKALQQVKKLTGLHGRWEAIGTMPAIILDVAHNEDGIKQLLKQVAAFFEKQPAFAQGKLHLVTGMVKDKEVEKVLALLPATAQYYFTNAHIPRALPATMLKDKASIFGLQGMAYENVNEALQAAKKAAKPTDLIIVCGSVFLVGEVEV